MAKTSSIERNKKRERLAKRYSAKRAKLKAIADNDSLAMEDRFAARLKLAVTVWKPRDVLGTPDDRQLGVMVDRVEVR